MQVVDEMHPSVQCVACGSAELKPFMHQNRYQISTCSACGLLQVAPMPSDEILREHYQNPRYFEGGQESQGYQNYAELRGALLPHFKRRHKIIRAAVPNGRTILDFGCAAGYFLEIAKQAGWRIYGVELSPDMARSASALLQAPIYTSLEEVLEHNIDVATLFEVIEHSPRPIEQLRLLGQRLRPGGLLMLSTPNNGHWQALREPTKWAVYGPPSHLVYFNRATLTDALIRAGFERIHIQGSMPLPELPSWLHRMTASLQRDVFSGKAHAPQASRQLSLYVWRAVRLVGAVAQKIASPKDDISTTLEALAFRPT